MSINEKLKKSFYCFWSLVKIGTFTFGGGWSIITQLQNEFVEKRAWITQEELLDITSIGRSLPGIMIINIAVIFGYRIAGPICAVFCAVGIALPSVIVISIITIFYNAFISNPYISRAMAGVRGAVIPIILSAAVRLKKSALTDKIQYLIAAGAFLICLFTSLNNILIVLLGAAAGLILKGVKDRAIS